MFDIPAFLAEVQAVHRRLGRCVIAVSEGVHDASGAAIITRLVNANLPQAQRLRAAPVAKVLWP